MTTDLTPEERERIYQEEKARREAVDRLASEHEAQQKAANLRFRQERYDRQRKRFKVAGIAMLSFFILIAVLAIVSPKKSSAPSGPSSAEPSEQPTVAGSPRLVSDASLSPGEGGHVIGEGKLALLMAPTKDALKRAEHALSIHDFYGAVKDEGARVLEGGTDVLVLEKSGDFYKARMMNGAFAGEAGWVRRDGIGSGPGH